MPGTAAGGDTGIHRGIDRVPGVTPSPGAGRPGAPARPGTGYRAWRRRGAGASSPVRGDEKPLGDLTVGRALANEPDDRELGGGQLRPAFRGWVRAAACPLHAAVAEQAADTGRVSFGPRGGLQPERLVQVADRLVLRPFREQPARIRKRRRADQRPRVAAVGLNSGQGPFGIPVKERARVQRGGAQPGKPGFASAPFSRPAVTEAASGRCPAASSSRTSSTASEWPTGLQACTYPGARTSSRSGPIGPPSRRTVSQAPRRRVVAQPLAAP